MGPKQGDRFREMVGLWRWSVREVLLYSKTSLNPPTTGPTLNGPFSEVVGLWNSNFVMADCLGPK